MDIIALYSLALSMQLGGYRSVPAYNRSMVTGTMHIMESGGCPRAPLILVSMVPFSKYWANVRSCMLIDFSPSFQCYRLPLCYHWCSEWKIAIRKVRTSYIRNVTDVLYIHIYIYIYIYKLLEQCRTVYVGLAQAHPIYSLSISVHVWSPLLIHTPSCNPLIFTLHHTPFEPYTHGVFYYYLYFQSRSVHKGLPPSQNILIQVLIQC